MGEETEDFAGVEQAWREFTRTLSAGIAGQETLLWELDVDERRTTPTGPYVQVTRCSADLPLAEVSSNRVLAASYQLGKAARQRLRELGWQRPGDGRLNYSFLVEPGLEEVAARMIVAALREVFGVIHPAFLIGLPQDDEPEPEEEPFVHPISAEQLDELVLDALTSDEPGATAPQRDPDGDLPFVADSAVIFVRVLRERPGVRLFCELVIGIEDLEAAAFEVAVLNRDQEFKFVLRDTRIIMSTDLPAWPFVPEHLQQILNEMCRLAPTLDGDLALRVRGHRFIEPSHGG